MKKFKIIKNSYPLIIGLIIGGILAGIGVYAAILVQGSNVSYSNSATKLEGTTAQSAINEINDMVNGRFVSAYTYKSSCVTGEESACVKNTCYRTKTANSCKAGDIIKYRVNDSTIVTFHVMYDNGSTILMQSQKNIIYNTKWNTSSKNQDGPLEILAALEAATAGWNNVTNTTYAAGETDSITGCSAYNSCTTNTYTLASRTVKARLISLQEASQFGCTESDKSCPKWMNNYLDSSTSYGGTKNDALVGPNGSTNAGYWTMNAYSSRSQHAWLVTNSGKMNINNVSTTFYGARAVVQVSKYS